MNFNEMRDLSKHIDAQISSLESKVACPMNIISSNSNQGVKVLSMLNGMIENVTSKKKEIEGMIQEENLSWTGIVEDYNAVNKFKSEIVANLNKYEHMWSSNYPDYKPFISYGRGDSANKELDSSLNVQSDKQIADQSLNDSINITMS